MDLKQGISYLERDTEKERVRHKERGGERAGNKNHGQRRVAQLVDDKLTKHLAEMSLKS